MHSIKMLGSVELLTANTEVLLTAKEHIAENWDLVRSKKLDILYRDWYCIHKQSTSYLTYLFIESEIDFLFYMTIIPKGCFAFLSNIEKISIPSTIIRIDDNAFYNCRDLKEIYISDSVTSISRNEVFSGCNKLRCIRIPSDIKDSKVFNNNINEYFSSKQLKNLKII